VDPVINFGMLDKSPEYFVSCLLLQQQKITSVLLILCSTILVCSLLLVLFFVVTLHMYPGLYQLIYTSYTILSCLQKFITDLDIFEQRVLIRI
jgi:hypothetical protein